jgi:FAD-dependent halogenase
MGIANHDAVVVGGGPGGSTTATLLARAGARVLLVEKEKFPRYQIGESLLPATVHGICRLLGVSDELHAAGFIKKRGGTFRWGKHSTPWTFDFGSADVNQILDFNFAYQVERAKFDELLLNNARRQGVEVREETAVTDVIQEGGRCSGVTLLDRSGRSTEARATFIIDASGNQSRLHALAGKRVFSKFFQNVALFGYFEGGDRLPAPHSGNIFSCAFPFGWFWYIPLSETLTSVGAVVAKEHAAKLRSGADHAMRQFIDACPEINQLLAKATRIEQGMYGGYRVRKDYSYLNSRFWVPGLVLVGDSACFVDPIFSSGVHLATYSGMLAARSIATILKRGMPEAVGLDLYERRYRLEYSVFYDFLVSFYDMHQDEQSYFWKARKVLGSDQAANHAFLQLVAGAGTTVAEFLRLRERSGELFQLRVDSTVDPDKRPALLRELMKERDMAQVHLRAVGRSARVGRTDGLDTPLDFNPGGDPATNDGYRVSPDGLYWERLAEGPATSNPSPAFNSAGSTFAEQAS